MRTIQQFSITLPHDKNSALAGPFPPKGKTSVSVRQYRLDGVAQFRRLDPGRPSVGREFGDSSSYSH
jgi:hypothetical protein